ncbi:ATP12 family chaperone protein [Novosphingobium sediminicola]|uniref:Chaperone required for assembly of F1-ATPase n=1 Tax=Novosphingobium sediminicola TaxID=563162 RepID=A0A7W6G4H5_9SPHN|nr:ATP12 family protein [Novosphingobium sediminicola]MBB3953246.1 chaperone required for assembly of F1-ATPase [Novosphingobium sediminicola]
MKRFYKEVSVAGQENVWQVTLDGRAIRTVGGQPQKVPTKALAEALAAEWAAQGEEIDPTSFILRDMADYALDVVGRDRAEAIASLLPYAETDTLCYRADPEDALFERQNEVWEPILCAVEARLGIRMQRVSGIMHKPQPAESLAVLRARLESADAFTLAALRNMSSLAASLLIALEALEPGADIAALWAAASLEEEWQADLWGRDWEAEERREKRTKAFALSAEFVGMVRG